MADAATETESASLTIEERSANAWDRPAIYRIILADRASEQWVEWLEGMTIAFEREPTGEFITILTAPIVDQAALRGLLARLWDRNMTILAVCRIESDCPWQGVGDVQKLV
jgi:hypothetical protein